jgi:hypothetical protein
VTPTEFHKWIFGCGMCSAEPLVSGSSLCERPADRPPVYEPYICPSGRAREGSGAKSSKIACHLPFNPIYVTHKNWSMLNEKSLPLHGPKCNQ